MHKHASNPETIYSAGSGDWTQARLITVSGSAPTVPMSHRDKPNFYWPNNGSKKKIQNYTPNNLAAEMSVYIQDSSCAILHIMTNEQAMWISSAKSLMLLRCTSGVVGGAYYAPLAPMYQPWNYLLTFHLQLYKNGACRLIHPIYFPNYFLTLTSYSSSYS